MKEPPSTVSKSTTAELNGRSGLEKISWSGKKAERCGHEFSFFRGQRTRFLQIPAEGIGAAVSIQKSCPEVYSL